MKILYLSCHSILEYDEVKLLTELGHDVFSMGSYINPESPHDKKRPPIQGKYDDHLIELSHQYTKDNLHPELIEPFDVIIVIHIPQWITNNWEKMKHKKVIWRTIGQSHSGIENTLAKPREEGLKIVRYSPEEKTIPGYIGEDAMIRFYKDKNEFANWNGKTQQVITVSQSMKARNIFCGFDIFQKATEGLPRKLYGPCNEDTGIEGGLLSYEDLKANYRDSRVYFYTGTYPASYTLNFIEALMTGIPIVAIGAKLANIRAYPGLETYEIHKIIKHSENGFCSDSPDELRQNIEFLLVNPEEAKRIGEAGRKTAIELFEKETIKEQWKDFLDGLSG